jgi:hypothetical protein
MAVPGRASAKARHISGPPDLRGGVARSRAASEEKHQTARLAAMLSSEF